MENIEVVKSGDTVCARIFRHIKMESGIDFMTQQDEAFQVGRMNRPAGYKVEPHLHPDRDIKVNSTSEFLMIQSGEIKITFYDDNWQEIHSTTLAEGDAALILGGGHSVEFLTEAQILEVKQGPYPGDNQAKVFKNSDS